MAGVEVLSFGCRLNALESEVMRVNAEAAGLSDAVIVNTCAVTAEASRQARQSIRKLRRETPERRLIVTGCGAEVERDRYAAMPEVDLVVGNAEKIRAETWLSPFDGDRVKAGDIMAERRIEPHALTAFGARTRAFVQVQNGCDHRCTFCTIPFGRGNSRSVPVVDVVAQVRRLVEGGHLEVVLTGVDITSWGADLDGAPKLGALVRAILDDVPELPRLRLSSVDSVEIDPMLMDAIGSESRLMPHLHLSLQAGDDLILKRMKRRHTRTDAVQLCANLRQLRPDIVFGADLIAGFPTETEEMFANSLRLVEECGLTWLHVFPYSARPGTPAARMPAVAPQDIRERAARLRAAGEAAVRRFLATEQGAVRAVLVEREGFGHTPHHAGIRLETDVATGTLVLVEVTGASGSELVGRVLRQAAA
jgi:threonylcarbamoyladenosine tRNA methylthiotransferase MtaB